jgi:hypothetical protein
MKVNIPFIKSEKDIECARGFCRWSLLILVRKHSLEEIGKLEETLPSGLTWTVGIAVAARKLGFPVKIISTTNFSHDDEIEFYKKNSSDEGQKTLFRLVDESKIWA